MVEKTESRVPAPAYVDPFQAFRSEMDKLAQTFFGRGMMLPWTTASTGEGGSLMPSIDVKEDAKAVVLTAELPGMDEKDVEVTVRNGVLVMKGEKRHAYEDTKGDVQVMERRYGTVERAMRLPEMVDAEKISAMFNKGVLTVTMPKRPEAAPTERKVAITH